MRPLGERPDFPHIGVISARHTHHKVVDTLIVSCALGVQIDVVAIVGVTRAAAEGLMQIDESGALELSDSRRAGGCR